MKYVIYGAQSIAIGVYLAITEFSTDKNILGFVVTDKENNVSGLYGLKVFSLEEFVQNYTSEICVLIAVPENIIPEIERNLNENKITNYVKIDSVRWANMMERLYIRQKVFLPISVCTIGSKSPNLSVYVAKFWRDTPLHCDTLNMPYFIPIQAGAALTDVRITKYLDNYGDNISCKNNNYSELTVLYWVWKNKILKDPEMSEHYYGLAHYRRYLNLDDDDLMKIKDNDIDVVLPYPMPCEPNITSHHKRYLSSDEWRATLQALNELHPEYVQSIKEVLNQKYMYNYNIIIAKGSVLLEYCQWLFSLLFRIEEIVNCNGFKKTNRYIGYIGETLETIYFLSNKNRFKIVHSGCKFIY